MWRASIRAAGPFIAISVVAALEAVFYGFSFPFFSLRLHAAGWSDGAIGLNASCGAAGSIMCGFLVPAVVRRIGYRNVSAICFAIVLVALPLLFIKVSTLPWFVARFALGIGSGGLWITTEAWLNLIVTDKHRDRVVSAFETTYELGFFVGPMLGLVVGYSHASIAAIGGLCVAALAMLRTMGGSQRLGVTAPRQPAENATSQTRTARRRWRSLLRDPGLAAVIALAGTVGLCETAIYSFLPIFAVERGQRPQYGATILAAFTLGPVFLSIPLAFISERVRRTTVIAVFSVTTAAGIAVCGTFIAHQIPAMLTAFCAGGLVVAMYNVAFSIIGERTTGEKLAEASAAFSIAYAGGGLAGGPLAGGVMGAAGAISLIVLITALLVSVGASSMVCGVLGPGRNSPPAPERVATSNTR